MALKKTITTIHGLEILDAYHRVEAVRIISKTVLAFNVCTYVDPTKPMIDGQGLECSYDLNGDNPLAQAYAHLKTLPEFEGAVGC
jgi:hypothetical protein